MASDVKGRNFKLYWPNLEATSNKSGKYHRSHQTITTECRTLQHCGPGRMDGRRMLHHLGRVLCSTFTVVGSQGCWLLVFLLVLPTGQGKISQYPEKAPTSHDLCIPFSCLLYHVKMQILAKCLIISSIVKVLFSIKLPFY